MDDCPTCPKSKNPRGERIRHSPRRRRYRPVSGRRRRFSPMGCEPCSREDVRLSRKPFTLCGPCEPRHMPSPCRERCYAGQTESGLLNTIRSSIQKIFTGRKPNQLYMYTMSQLKCVEQLVNQLEDDTCSIEGMIKKTLECECNIDLNEVRCLLNSILNRVEGVKCDLTCARDCYDPCRDRCEFEFICCLMERVINLERHLQEMCLHLDCLQVPVRYDTCCAAPMRRDCRSNCRKCCCSSGKTGGFSFGCPKPCEYSNCCKQGCDTGCRTTCFEKPKCCGPRNPGKFGNCLPKGLCRTSSVIPVGVMLVKL